MSLSRRKGAIKLPIFDIFRPLCKLTVTLMAIIFGSERDRPIDNRKMTLETTQDPCNVPKFNELSPTNAENRTCILMTLPTLR